MNAENPNTRPDPTTQAAELLAELAVSRRRPTLPWDRALFRALCASCRACEWESRERVWWLRWPAIGVRIIMEAPPGALRPTSRPTDLWFRAGDRVVKTKCRALIEPGEPVRYLVTHKHAMSLRRRLGLARNGRWDEVRAWNGPVTVCLGKPGGW